jgi:hemolysin III
MRVRDPVSGFSHLAGLALAAIGAGFVLARSHDAASLVTNGTYVVCLLTLYAASSAYHLVSGSDALVQRLRKLDHGAIFLMIAGSCTPLFVHAFDGAVRVAMLSAVWGLAAIGILVRVAFMHAPRALYTAMYVAMGWLVVVQAPRAVAALPAGVVALVVAGGVTYTVGALVYATKRPNPFPPHFGFHEVWHLFVLGGSALHYAAVLALA